MIQRFVEVPLGLVDESERGENLDVISAGDGVHERSGLLRDLFFEDAQSAFEERAGAIEATVQAL
jgi:hypothetical protein